MRIAILGGAFDPPHIGHYLVARQTLEKLHMDEVWFMVCYQYFPEFPIKNFRISSYTYRYKMVEYISTPPLIVSNFESNFNKSSKTINTLRLLKEHYPQHMFYWIIGSDQLETFRLWNKWSDIVQNHNLIIFPRDTNFVNLENRVKRAFQLNIIPSHIIILEETELIVSNISSSLIRKRIRTGLPIKGMVDEKVERYIRKNKLYKIPNVK